MCNLINWENPPNSALPCGYLLSNYLFIPDGINKNFVACYISLANQLSRDTVTTIWIKHINFVVVERDGIELYSWHSARSVIANLARPSFISFYLFSACPFNSLEWQYSDLMCSFDKPKLENQDNYPRQQKFSWSQIQLGACLRVGWDDVKLRDHGNCFSFI